MNIVIVGAGFGGLQTALLLEKKFSAGGGSAFGGKNNKNIALTLIDRRDYHLFTPNLYEVAAAEEELVSVAQIKKSITLPFSEILQGKKIKFIKGSVESLDTAQKQVKVSGKLVPYDFVVLALGSESDFFGVEGAKQYSLTLKSLPDALRIRNKIEFAIQAHKQDMAKKNLRIVVAGGGYTGLELAGEIKGLADYLAWKNQYPREKIEIEIIEAGNKLVAGFDNRLSEDAYARLAELNLHINLASRIAKVESAFIELADGEKIAYDVLLWTTGVKAESLSSTAELVLDNKNRLVVGPYFQVQNFHEVFALGDIACVMGSDGRPVPSSAQDAWDQAKYLSYALPYLIKNQKPPKPYKNKHHGFIVNLGGKWAILDDGKLYLKGFLGYLANQFAHMRYYSSLVGWFKATKYILFQMEMYSRND